MKDTIYELTERVRNEVNKRREYYTKASKQIATANLNVLVAANIAVAIALIAFILITPSIIKGWEPTVYHLSFLPVILILCIVNLGYYLSRKKHIEEREVMFLCALFIVLLTGFCVLIDTGGTPAGRSTFSDMMFIVLPAIFIMPYRWVYSLVAVMEVLYIVAIMIFKEDHVGQYDIFSSIVALACSVVVFNIITHLRVRDYRIQSQYRKLSMIDTLTGILNKQSSFETLKEYLKVRDDDTICVLILMDLDDFKGANDTLGHAVGDTILRHVGTILREAFWSDIVGRFGGDEFIVFVKGTSSMEMIRKKSDSIRKRLAECTEADVGMPVSCSFGAVVVKGRQGNLKGMFRQADAALYEAKRGGKSKCVIRTYEGHMPTAEQ